MGLPILHRWIVNFDNFALEPYPESVTAWLSKHASSFFPTNKQIVHVLDSRFTNQIHSSSATFSFRELHKIVAPFFIKRYHIPVKFCSIFGPSTCFVQEQNKRSNFEVICLDLRLLRVVSKFRNFLDKVIDDLFTNFSMGMNLIEVLFSGRVGENDFLCNLQPCFDMIDL